MKKIRLNVDALDVESFEPGEAGGRQQVPVVEAQRDRGDEGARDEDEEEQQGRRDEEVSLQAPGACTHTRPISFFWAAASA